MICCILSLLTLLGPMAYGVSCDTLYVKNVAISLDLKQCFNYQIDTTVDSVFTFIQTQPIENSIPHNKTVVKCIQDNDGLIILCKCYDDKIEKLSSWISPRDKSAGDYISVYMSGLCDDETGYKFKISAGNVQSDAIIYNDGRNNDYSWDGVWYSDVFRDSISWNVAVKIPFKTIRFISKGYWKIGFERFIQRNNEYDYYPAIKIQEGVRISNLSTFRNIAPDRHGKNIELYPYYAMKYERLEEKKYSFNGGVDAFWGYNPSNKLFVTVNPEFAQIESDPERINLSRYELYFNEKRPFFIEGAGNFRTPIQLLYTRRIGENLPDGQRIPIYTAFKTQNRINRYELSTLFAYCGGTKYINSQGVDTLEERSAFPVVRLKRSFGQNSYWGIFYGSKLNRSNIIQMYSGDCSFRASDQDLTSQIAYTNKKGFGYNTSFTILAKNYYLYTSSEYYNSKFNINDIGYISSLGQTHQIVGGPVFYSEKALQRFSLFGTAGISKANEAPVFNKNVRMTIEPVFKKYGITANIEYQKNYEMNRYYSNYYSGLWVWPTSQGKFYINPGLWYNTRIYNYYRNYWGSSGGVYIETSYKLLSNIEIKWDLNDVLEWKPNKAFEKSTYENELWFNWSFTKDMHFKVYYNPQLDHHYHKVNVLFTYNYSPKSWLFIAYNENIDNSTGKAITKDRIITIKINKLIWW